LQFLVNFHYSAWKLLVLLFSAHESHTVWGSGECWPQTTANNFPVKTCTCINITEVSEAQSELLYDWHFFNWIFGFIVLMEHSLSREDGSVVYNCCWASPAQSISGPTQAGLVTTFYCLTFETPQPGGPGPHIYIPQEHGDPVMPPGTGFPFRRLLRLSVLRWSYSSRPPHGSLKHKFVLNNI
jgi:hypothetical protein